MPFDSNKLIIFSKLPNCGIAPKNIFEWGTQLNNCDHLATVLGVILLSRLKQPKVIKPFSKAGNGETSISIFGGIKVAFTGSLISFSVK